MQRIDEIFPAARKQREQSHLFCAEWGRLRTQIWSDCELQNAPRSTRMPRGKSVPQFVPDGGDVITKRIVLTLVLCFVAGAVCFASDAQIGTWKLNETKSKLAPGLAKNTTVVLEAMGDDMKATV